MAYTVWGLGAIVAFIARYASSSTGVQSLEPDKGSTGTSNNDPAEIFRLCAIEVLHETMVLIPPSDGG